MSCAGRRLIAEAFLVRDTLRGISLSGSACLRRSSRILSQRLVALFHVSAQLLTF